MSDSSTPSSHSTPQTTNTSTERPERERPRKGSITLDTALKPAPGKATISPPHVAETQATHTISRRPSWLASFSQKFSSSGSDVATTPATPTSTDSTQTASQSQTPISQASQPSQSQASQTPASNAPQKPSATTSIASAGFLINTLRRLSSSGATAREAFSRRSSQQPQPQCERVILNKDSRRDRSGIPELDGNRLRKVSFCVDVEVAPCHEDVQERKDARKRRREEREKMRRLKEDGTPETAGSGTETPGGVANTDGAGAVEDGAEKKAEGVEKKEDGPSEKKEGAEDSQDRLKSSSAPSTATDPAGSTASPAPTSSTTSTDKPKPRKRVHPKATTNPLKIYTQCCQLRETSIVTVIKESLLHQRLPATLPILDLTSLRLPLHDLVTLADFLALVPIRKLVLENCDIDDHILRMLLSGLGAVKKITQEEPELDPDDTGPRKQRGAVERLSIKGNKRITKEGWRMLSTFVHMNRSLRALDCSGILMPRGMKVTPNIPLTPYTPMTPTTPASAVSIKSLGTPTTPQSPMVNKTMDDPATLLSKALSDRLCGYGLEELVLAGCGLDTQQLSTILEGVTKGGTRRLGLGQNPINDDGLAIIGAWLKTGACEALDLSGVDVSEHINILSCSLIETSPLAALSLSACSLNPTSLTSLLPSLSTLSNLRHLDLSSNPALFSTTPSAFHALRQHLPELKMLRKLDLSKTGMSSDQAIALCELLPQIPQLSYFRIVGNNLLGEGDGSQSVAETRVEATAEEGAALYTALVAAVKVSRTIVRIDLDDPPVDSADVIHRLSRKLLAYCLRNMEANASNDDWSVGGDDVTDSVNNLATPVEQTTVNRTSEEMESSQELAGSTIVGTIKNESTIAGSTLNGTSIAPSIPPSSHGDDDDDEEDEEDDHVVGTGVVKALGVCLGNSSTTGKEANEMSKALLTRARNIKARIQPALARAAVGETEEMQHRRLLFLDDTLFRVIMRFEEEYPSCKLPATSVEGVEPVPAMVVVAEEHRLAESQEPEFQPPQHPTVEYQQTIDPPNPPDNAPGHPDSIEQQQERRDSTDSQPLVEEEQPRSISRAGSRRNSSTDLHSRYLQEEEGRMHVLGTRLLEASRKGTLMRTESLDGEELKRRIIEGEISAPTEKIIKEDRDGEDIKTGRIGLAPGEMGLEGEICIKNHRVNGVGQSELEQSEPEQRKTVFSGSGIISRGTQRNSIESKPDTESGRSSQDISPVSSVTFHTAPSYQPSPPPRPAKSASRKSSSASNSSSKASSTVSSLSSVDAT
ncbi:hypothetical protein FPQ18DRAFT_332576 [Pyronema domesticum]|nr:hypothetical protein FPQ18DRAFT_332576 [Pyronema domesticum]